MNGACRTMANPFAKDIFPRVIVNYVPRAIVDEAVDAVLPAEVVGDARKNYIQLLSPNGLNDLIQLMQALISDLTSKGLLDAFKTELFRLSPANIRVQEILSGQVQVDSDGKVLSGDLQSLTNRRQPFYNSKILSDFMAATRHRVCAIWAGNELKGTGFLIAPDLVITAYHVVASLIRQISTGNVVGGVVETKDEPVANSRQSLACVFDYWTLANPFRLNPAPAGVIVVDAAENWLEFSSRRHPCDGISHQFDLPDVRKYLDCVAIRLSRPIGAEACGYGGGRIRGWIHLGNGFNSMAQGDIIAILQHPGGGPQGFDKGDFFDRDASETRIWYTTETANGSSGSPCFDSEANILGFHNAGRPTAFEGTTCLCNQGVRIDHVINAMPHSLFTEIKQPRLVESALWSISDDAENPTPILGRGKFKEAVLQLLDPRADKRVIVVEPAADVRDVGNSGKTFSTKILKAIARDRSTLVVEFSAKDLHNLGEENLLKEIAKKIGVADSALEHVPSKSDDERQTNRWSANDLPDWFGQIIENRAIESGTATTEAVTDPATGAATGQELVVKELIWIVIDDIDKDPPEGGMKELLAGMMGVTDTQHVLRAGLKALRWLIIGHIPDFARERLIEYEHDVVSQKAIGESDWVECLKSFYISSGHEDLFQLETARLLYNYSLSIVPEATNPTHILPELARCSVAAIKSLRDPRST
jgi:hypothetical protein